MKEVYKKLIEMEDFYRDMKKKHPTLNMWDELLDMIDKHKSKILNSDMKHENKK